MVYNLPVMEEKVKPHQVTTLHMVCALAFIVTGAIIVVYNYTIPLWGAAILSAGILLTVLVMAKNKWVISKPVNPLFRIAELLISISISAYSFVMHWKFPTGIFGVLSAAIIFAIFWEKDTGKPLSVRIDMEGIMLPSNIRKRFKPWTEVEGVILRFGTLTLSFTDNSIFQWDITNPDFDNEIFEAYCRTQIEVNRSKRRRDDW
jgi:hypothetical protein